MGCKSCSDVTLLNGTDGNGIQTIVDNGNGTFTIFMTNGTTFTSANLTGPAATVTAGTATGLAPGAAPTVANGGTTSAAVFNFGIPAGATGATGPQGLGILTQRTTSTTSDLGLAAVNKLTTFDNAGAIVITIKPNATIAFAAGQTLVFQKTGAGQLTFTADAGVTLNTVAASSIVYAAGAGAQYTGGILVQGTVNNWFLIKMS
jgi:hypothetical protein